MNEIDNDGTVTEETKPTKPRYVRKAKAPDVDDLMKRYGVKWGQHNGKRVLNFSSKVPQHARDAIYAALKEL